jgi:hypothetical protein
MKMITVEPVPGFRIINPADGHTELTAPFFGPDMPYWRARAAEGAVTIIEDGAAAAPTRPAPVVASPAIKK